MCVQGPINPTHNTFTSAGLYPFWIAQFLKLLRELNSFEVDPKFWVEAPGSFKVYGIKSSRAATSLMRNWLHFELNFTKTEPVAYFMFELHGKNFKNDGSVDDSEVLDAIGEIDTELDCVNNEGTLGDRIQTFQSVPCAGMTANQALV